MESEITTTDPRYRATPNLGAVLRVQGRRTTWLARQLGVTQPHISRVISGERTLAAASAERASTLLGVPISLLFELSEASISTPVESEEAA